MKTKIEQGNDWNKSINEIRLKSEKRAWIIASISIFMFFLCVVTISMLVPLKQTMPYLIKLNTDTGVPEYIPMLKEYDASSSEALTKYWLHKYVISRESYDPNLASYDYNLTMAFSTGDAKQTYYDFYESKNAPHIVYKRLKNLKVKILSIVIGNETYEGTEAATIRFEKQTIGQKGIIEKTETWVATVAYYYDINLILTEEQRFINPFGFKIDSFRLDPEHVTINSKGATL